MNRKTVVSLVVGLSALCVVSMLLAVGLFWMRSQAEAPRGDIPRRGDGEALIEIEGSILGMAFSPDWSALALGTQYAGAQVWGVADRAQILAMPEGRVKSLAYSPDGSLLALAWEAPDGQRRQVEIRQAGTGALLRTMRDLTERVDSLAFSPDGRLLAVGTFVDVRLCEVETGDCGEKLDAQGWRVAFSPDGTLLAAGGDDIVLWSVAGASFVAQLDGWYHPLFSPDGATLAAPAASRGLDVQLWRTGSREPLARLEQQTTANPPPQIQGMAYSPDGRLLATATNDGSALVWDVATETVSRTVEFHQTLDSGAVAISPNGRVLAVQNGYGVYVWALGE